jgi:D-xylonolactonase
MDTFNSPILLADYCCDTGEGPTWNRAEQRLYWTDIPTGRVFRYDPQAGKHEQCLGGRLVAAFTIQEDGSFLLFGKNGSISIWSDGAVSEIVPEIPSEVGTRFNDVAVDPAGRVFCGTMSSSTHPGRLFRLNNDASLDVLIEGVGISNGIGFTTDRRTMYLSESKPGLIHAFDYDEVEGSIRNQRIFAEVPPDDGVPDGLTVDADNYVWSARWDGYCAVRYAPDGSIDRKISFPVPKVSSLIFGGPDFTDLYVTTAGGHQKHVDGPLAGSLFVVKNAGKGVPDYLSKVAIPSR